MNREKMICESLKKFGFACERRIRLYGEDLQLVSNAMADGNGYSVLALAVWSGNLKHLRVPLSIVRMLERDLEKEEAAQLVA